MVTVIRKRVRAGRANKWGKGRTSDCNPATTHYRNAITQFNRSNDNSLKLLVNQDSDSCMSSVHTATTAQTFNTWASNWTGCTNSVFSHVFKLGRFNPNLHKKILAVLATAVRLLGKDNQGESEVEYFAVLTNILQNSSDLETLGACLYCIKLVARKVPPAILCQKYEFLTNLYVKSVQNYENDMLIVNSAVECLSYCFKAIPDDNWTFPPQHFMFFLSYCIHHNAKIRKKVRKFIGTFINEFNHHKMIKHITKFLLDNLNKNISEAKNKETLYLLAFSAEFVAHMNSSLPVLIELLLKLLLLNVSKINLAVIKVLYIAFRSKNSYITASTLSEFIKIVSQFKPNNNDNLHLCPFLQMFVSATRFLFILDSQVYVNMYVIISNLLLEGLGGSKQAVDLSLAGILESLSYLKEVWSFNQGIMGDTHYLNLMEMITHLQGCINLQYKDNFDVLFKIFESIYSKFGDVYPDLMFPSLRSLASLRESEGFAYSENVEKAISYAITSMGPERILNAIPLEFNPDDKIEKFSRSWMLPLLAKSVKNADLGYFVHCFVPMIEKIKHNSLILEKYGRLMESKTLHTVNVQIWNILPAFCDGAKNITKNIENVAERLYDLCHSEPIHMGMVLRCVRRLAKSVKEDEKPLICNYLRTFVSFFINQLSQEFVKGPLHAEYISTIRDSIGIFDQQSISSVMTVIVDKIESCLVNMESRESVISLRGLLSIAKTLISYLGPENMEKLKKSVVSILEFKGSVDSGVQKKAYLIMGKIIENFLGTGEIFQEIDDLLKIIFETTPSICTSSAKSARFRCILLVSRCISWFSMDIFNNMLTEGVLGVDELGKKAREGALVLIKEAFEYIKRTGDKTPSQSIDVIVSKLMIGLVGSGGIVKKSLVALKSLISTESGVFSEEMMTLCLQNGTQLLTHQDSSVVMESLGLLHCALMFFSNFVLLRHIHTIIPAVMAVAGLEASSKMRIKRRRILIKAYKLIGLEPLRELVPQEFHKVLSNVAKCCRKKTTKEDDAVTFCGHDMTSIKGTLSDSDEETVVTRRSKTSKGSVRIKKTGSNVIDLADPSSINKIIARDYVKSKRKKSKVPVTADGKIMVLDDDVGEMSDYYEKAEKVDMKKPRKKNLKGNRFNKKGQKRKNKITLPASQRRARRRHGH